MLKRLRFHSLRFLALPLVMLTSGCALIQDKAPVQIDVADYRAYLAEDHPVRQGLRQFAESVETRSGGTLKVRVRTDAIQGAPAKQLEQFQQGHAGMPQLMLFAGTGLTSLHPAIGYLDLPFVLRDAQHADAQLSGPFGQALLAQLKGKGLVGVGLWENGFRHVTNSTAPLMTIQDMSGMKFRVTPDAVFEDTFKAVGAKTVQLPFSRLRRALEDKSVAAQDNFLAQIWVGGLHEVQPYLSLTHHSYGVLVMAANEAFWNGLSAKQKDALKLAALDAGNFQRKASREHDKQVLELLQSKGVLISAMPPEELSKWKNKTEFMRQSFKNSMNADLLKQVSD